MGPSVPLGQGLRSSRGHRRSPLPLIPWRHHNCQSGEAQSWARASWCWCPACCAGPRSPPTPLELAWGGEPWRPGLHRSLARGRGTAVCRGLDEIPLPSPPSLAGLPNGYPPAPLPPPWGGRSNSRGGCNAVVAAPPSAGARPAAEAGVLGAGSTAAPSWNGGESWERGGRSSALAQGARWLVGGGGGGSFGCDPPCASLAAL